VTEREICRTAHANVAAVNYHFGDKLRLYEEVLQGAIHAMRDITEAARAAGEGRAPDEKLRRYLVLFLRQLLRPGTETLHRLIQREMHDPTPALDALVEQGVRPRVAYLCEIVSDMIGCDAADPRVLRCAASIQAQAVSYIPNPIARRLGFHFEPTQTQIDDAARHIADFSVAGVHAVGRARSTAACRHGRRAAVPKRRSR
jgi:AcrR family transcriptional regulator